MKKILFLIIPLIVCFSNAWAEISIQNDQKYMGTDGALHIVGEIQNNMEIPLNQVTVLITLFSNNEIIETIQTKSMVNTIMPGMKAPFDLVILGNNANLVDSYSLDLDYKVSSPKGQVIDITSSEMSRDSFDNLVISGKVANKGEITANSIVIVATLYDRDGNVAAVSKSHAEPDYLRSDQEIFFLVSVPDKVQTNSAVDYSIIAESEEYAAVPEFPFSSMILLASSVSAYIVLTRYSRKVIANLVCASNLK